MAGDAAHRSAARSPYDLMQRVLTEKCPAWTEEQEKAFAEKFKTL
jgi:hypothetical protein